MNFYLINGKSSFKILFDSDEITIGRGANFEISNTKVSRRHALMKLINDKPHIKPVHSNPTFLYEKSNDFNQKILPTNEWCCLHDGDKVSFLPDDLFFQVLAEGDGNVTEEDPIQTPDVIPETQFDAEPNNTNSTSTKTISPANESSPIKRSLPNWMSQSNTESVSSNSKKTTSTKKPRKVTTPIQKRNNSTADTSQSNVSVASTTQSSSIMVTAVGSTSHTSTTVSTSTTITPSSIAASVTTPIQNHNNSTADTSQSNVSVASTTQSSSVVVTAVGSTSTTITSSSVAASVPSLTSATKKRKSCIYGSKCYRKNPIHRKEESHPGDSDYEEVEDDDDDLDDNDKPECPYGTDCYRKNPQHKREFKHTVKPSKRPKRTAAQKRSVIADDSDNSGINDYDYNDSFIDDESLDVPSDSSDSDYQPDESIDKDEIDFLNNTT